MTGEAIYSDLLADDPALASLIEEFVADLRAACAVLAAALASGDAEAVKSIAHTWRGSAGGHGFDPLTEAADGLHEAVKRAAKVDDNVRRAAEGFFAVAARVRPGWPVSVAPAG